MCARCVLHHDSVIPVEGDRHYAGELSAPLHPQVPAKTLLSAQLLQTDLLELNRVSVLVYCWRTERFPNLHLAKPAA